MMHYYAYDGDQVGRQLECLLIDNNDRAVSDYAKAVGSALDEITSMLKHRGCSILFASGDSILAKSSTTVDIDDIPRRYGKITFSLGIGKSSLDAMLALKQAKLLGGGRVVTFNGARVRP